MAPLRLSLLAVLVAGCITSAYAQPRPQTVAPVTVPDSCPVTKPGDQPFIPPFGYPKKLGRSSFWHGTDRLWVGLPLSGTWRLGHYEPNDPTYRQKIIWWRQGLHFPTEFSTPFRITGQRLDASAPQLLSDPVSGTSVEGDVSTGALKPPAFIMSGVNFPTLGCWEVTGHYGTDELTFVIWITPQQQSD